MGRSGQDRRAGRRRRDDGTARESTSGVETAREDPLAALHSAGGNQAVGSALGDERVDRATDDGESESVSEESETAIAGQPKLEVSEPDDRCEREAERVAATAVRRSPAEGRNDARVRIQRQLTTAKSGAAEGEAVGGDAAAKVDAATRGGRPLSASTRSFFEPRLGRDLGDVRVHTGSTADAAARSLDAVAFTRGTNIVFRQGRFDPESRAGKRLIAHELTHVLQHDASPESTGAEASRVVQRQPGPDAQQAGGAPKPAVDAKIDGDMPVLEQPDPSTCWAATAAMMVMYRDQARSTISEAIGRIDERWQTRFDNGHGLLSTEMSWFMADAGLVHEPQGLNFTVEAIADLIETHGPLWMNADVDLSKDKSIHARIIVGIEGDGTPSGTEVRFVDPSDGKVYTRTFDRFTAELEEEHDAHAEGIQIVHWP